MTYKSKNFPESKIETVSEIEQLPAYGAASKYRPEMCNMVIEVAKSEGFHAAMANACGISMKTFYRYIEKYPEFKEAVEKADTINLEIQERMLVDGAKGKIKNYNFSANAMVLNNKYKSMYTRPGSGDNTEITINTVNLTPEQIDLKIAQKLERFRSLGEVIDLPKELISSVDAESAS